MTDNSSDDRLDAAVDEATALRQAVEGLANVILASAPKEDKRFKTSVALLLIGGPILFALTMAFAIVNTVQGNDRDKLIRQGIACLLADTDDHRHTNKNAHEQLAKAHGVVFDQVDSIPLTEEQATKFKQECNPYIKATVGLPGYGVANK
jgi:hypothetical protein